MTQHTIVITGASTGIGAACARLAAQEGHDVILTYRSDARAARQVAQDVAARGQEARVYQCDVTSEAQIEALFADLPQDLPIHLVNNAGIVGEKAALADLTARRLQTMFSVNVIGTILTTQKAVAHMRRCGVPGHIVNISSAAARLGAANQYIDYAATKGAIDTLTLGLADELAPEGIRVNSVRPGLIDTAIHAKGGDPDRLDRLGHSIPLGRPGSAEEVAESVLWLLSDRASYVTKSLLDVTGGR
ncbi:SDR family oxidoreductase [Thalassobius sp. S69A]|uniref:SDR family oxidoreductase n=1 Tax=unclassified Thalassovita TaxID=2619711 RepID=UPI003C7E6D3E